MRSYALDALACLVAIVVLASAAQASERQKWAANWNARVEAAAGARDKNPCGDFVFDAWTKEFLAVCDQFSKDARKECKQRTRWVWQRSDQCSRWQDWLLRNHNKNKRRDNMPEPEVRVGGG